jgi:Uma2 family endonuclease
VIQQPSAFVKWHVRNFERVEVVVKCALVIEVSDVTLSFDRAQKSREYAASGIPEYWIVNLVDRQIEVHRLPQSAATGPEYRIRELITSSATIKLQIEGVEVAELQVSDLLP